MSYQGSRGAPKQSRTQPSADSDSARAPEQSNGRSSGRSVAPGKGAPPGRGPGPAGRAPAAPAAGASGVVQQKRDAAGGPVSGAQAAGAQAAGAQAAQTNQWLDTALRPDLFPPPGQGAPEPAPAGGPIQRKAGGEGAAASAVQSTAGGGQALPGDVQSRMEQSLGADFSAVRVHEGAAAGSIGALAYTQGTDIHFQPGQYQPHSQQGQELLGHELAHVVQQSEGRVQATTQAKGVGINDDGALEREADALGARAARGEVGSASTTPAVSARGGRQAPVQRFMSQEHQSLGNDATGNQQVNAGGANQFDLSHGDIVALSGDWFSPDDLFRLAGIEGDRGTRVGTRDELVCALKIITEKESYTDARFEAGGQWADWSFPDEVRRAVDARYKQLAGQNTNHFLAPRGRGPNGDPIPDPDSGGSFYRSYHQVALLTAFQAGVSGGNVSHAMAREAAAQHWLTDAFAAGHSRTPVGSIREHWSRLYPLFWYNLRHKMALDTAIEMNERADNFTGAMATVQMMYEGISGEIEAMAGSLPEVGLGDLLSKVFHDHDNEQGLAIAGGGHIFGDSHLDDADPQNVTRQLCEAAIRAGVADVALAFQLGSAGAQLDNEQIYAAVRAQSGASGALFLPEEMIPRPDTSANEPQNWQAASFEALWGQPLVGSGGDTVGAVVTRMLGVGGEIRAELEGLATQFPPVDDETGDLEPRQAFLDGFLNPLSNDPFNQIVHTINWAPNYGLRGVDRDDISVMNGQEMERQDLLPGMTTEARVSYIKELIGGSCDADDEGALVVRLFETAPAGERARIYELVEGHPWTGDWIEGMFVDDDDIWNALSREQLTRLRGIINGN